MNNCTFTGYVGKQPELRTTKNDKNYCSFSLAVRQRDKSTLWISCTAWSKAAELISQYVKKGDQISLCGEIGQSEYQTQSGERRVTLDLTIQSFSFIKSDKAVEDDLPY